MLGNIKKVLYILPAGKPKLAVLSIAFITVSLMESFGIGIIGPYVAIATDPSLIAQYSLLSKAYSMFNFSSASSFVALLGFAILLFSIFRAFLSWSIQVLIFRFGYEQQAALISKLMDGYLNAPYTFYLKRNSSQIIQNVVIETKNFTANVLIPLLISLSSIFVLLFLSLLLFLTSPMSVMVLLAVCFPLIIFFNSFKGRISRWGKSASLSEKTLIGLVGDSVGGIKEIKVIGCQEHFQGGVEGAAQTRSRNMGSFYAYRQAPRYFVEALMVTFLVGFVAINLLFEKDIAELTSVLSIFALSSIRIIPAANQFLGGITNLKNASFIIDKLYLDLMDIENYCFSNQDTETLKSLNENATEIVRGINSKDSSLPEASFKDFRILKIDKLAYSYPNSSINAIDDLSFNIRRGESVALIGKSGSGKTTLVDVILGLLTPSSGDITIDNVSIYKNIRVWQNLIGYISQNIYLVDDSIEKNIAFGIAEDAIDQDKLKQSIELAQLNELVSGLPDRIKTRIGERGSLLSGGQRQRIGIARALYHGQEVLILDEATAALDNETEKLVTEAINSLKGKRTMIIIAHRLSTIEKCDRIYLMDAGKIVNSGSYQDLVLDVENVY